MAARKRKRQVSIHFAKQHFSRVMVWADAGDTVVIRRGQTPIATLTPWRRPGLFKGKIRIGPEFFEPLPEDELEAWENPK